MLPRWSATVALVTAVVSYLAWTAAATDDDSGEIALLTLITAVIFWLAVMVLAAYLVQRAVIRFRDRERR